MQRSALLCGAAVVAALTLTAPTAMAVDRAAAAPTAPYTAMVVNGTEGGGSFVRDASTTAFQAVAQPAHTVFQMQAASGPFVVFAATDPIAVGTLAVNGATQNPTGLRLSDGAGKECVVTGTIDVTEVSFGPDDLPTAFTADYSGTCASGQPSTGQIRFRSATGYQGLDIPDATSWSAPFVGERNAPTAVTATARGTGTTTISGVNVVGASPAGFVVPFGQDSCTGATLADGQSCTVTVAASPRALSPASVTEHLSFTTTQPTSPVRTALSYTGAQLSKRGQYFPTSARVMDTRSGLGVRKGVVAGGTAVSLPVAGRNGVPATGVGAAVFNVTVTGATASSFATVYASGTTRPGTSNLNFAKGFTGANLVTVPLGANGAVSFYNGSGSTHFVADLVGYYAAGPTFAKSGGNDLYTTAPTRLLDTRTDWGVKLAPTEYFGLPLDFGADRNARIRGAVITVTAANATAAGFLSVTPTEPVAAPKTSSVNYAPGAPVANLVASQTTQVTWTDGVFPTVWVANSTSASTDVIIDIVALYAQEVDGDEGLRFKPIAPTRILDTRSDRGAKTVGAGVNTVVPAPLTVAGRDTWALAGNITGVTPTANTYLTVWDEGARPGISSVNLTEGVTRANAAWTGLGTNNTYRVFNKTGTTETLYDVSGTFEGWPASLETVAGVPWPVAPAKAAGTGKVAPEATTAARGAAPAPLDPRRVLPTTPQHH